MAGLTWLNTAVRASAELRYRSAALTFRQPGVAMRFSSIGCSLTTFPCSSHASATTKRYRLRAGSLVTATILIPIAWLRALSPMALFKIHAPDGAFQTALVTGHLRQSVG